MKRSWLTLAATVLIGLLAGVALAGRPTTADQTVIPATTAPAPTSEPATTSTTAASTTTAAAPSTTEPSTTTTALDPATVRMLAANGTRRSGVATRTADRLKAVGFTQTSATDSIDPVEVSTIYYRDGFADAAAAAALALGLDPAEVVPYAQPISSIDDTGDVIVALGADFQE